MGGTSYQDIETRLRVVESKLDFVMKTFSIRIRHTSLLVPGQAVEEQKTMLDVYHDMNRKGIVIGVDTPEPPAPVSESPRDHQEPA